MPWRAVATGIILPGPVAGDRDGRTSDDERDVAPPQRAAMDPHRGPSGESPAVGRTTDIDVPGRPGSDPAGDDPHGSGIDPSRFRP